MRALILAVAAAALALPASAADWGRYQNARHGYAVDVPPGFVDQGQFSGDAGRRFETEGGRQRLTFWGSPPDGRFADAVKARVSSEEESGWTMTYQTVSMLSASWSGVRGDGVVYSRAAVLCGGTRWAGFTLEYDAADLAAMDAVVERLVKSLKPSAPC